MSSIPAMYLCVSRIPSSFRRNVEIRRAVGSGFRWPADEMGVVYADVLDSSEFLCSSFGTIVTENAGREHPRACGGIDPCASVGSSSASFAP